MHVSPLTEHFFDSAGVALRFVDAGRGEPVVLLHSFTGSFERDFVACGLFAALVPRYRVIGLDLRGHGGSGKPHDPRHYGREMALDVVRLLDHLRLAKAHIVGYSLGAHITAQFVTLHPERCASATLGGAPGRRHWSIDDDRRVAIEADELDQGLLSAQLLRLRPQNEPPPDDDAIRARTAVYLTGNDPQALAAVRRANRDQVIRDEQLASAGVPILGIVASGDRYLAEFREQATRVCRVELVIIEGATHENAPAQPAFHTALLAFLRAHPCIDEPSTDQLR